MTGEAGEPDKVPSLYEQFTQLGKDSTSYLLGSAANRLIAVILLPIYTRYLTPSDYGVSALVTAVDGLVALFLSLELGAAFVRSYFDVREESRKEVLASALYFTAAWTAVLLVALVPLSVFLSRSLLGSRDLYMLLVLAFATAVMDANAVIPLSLLRCQRRSRTYVLFRLARFVSGIVLNIVFVVYLGRGVRGIFEAGLISSALLLVAVLLLVLRELSWTFRVDLLGDMLRYGLPLMPASIASWVTLYSDRLLLEYFRDAAEVGLYNLGHNIGFAFRLILVSPLSLAWAPVAFAAFANRESAARLYSRALTYYSVLGSFLCLAFVLLPRSAVVILSTPRFYAASKVVPLIAASYLMQGSCIVLGTGVRLAKKTKYLAAIYVAAAVLNVVLNLFLVPGYGMMGAGLAALISQSCIALSIHLVSNRLLRVEYEWGRLVKVLVAALTVAFSGLMFRSDSAMVEAAGRGVLILAFPLLLFALRFFTPLEAERLRSLPRSGLRAVKGRLRR